MGSRVVDISGNRYGRLVVVRESGRNSKSQVIWECLCDCGQIKNVLSWNLIGGVTKSCGCLKAEKVKTQSVTHGGTVSGSKKLEYSAWLGMKARCYNPKNTDYKNYGGRGIKVCDRWVNSFENFLKDMGSKPSNKHSLDRYPNVDGDYGPSNCRWATEVEQQKNRRNNKWLEYDGVRMIRADWARELNISPSNLCNHLKNKTIEQLAKEKLSK